MLLPYIRSRRRLADAVDVDRGAATEGHEKLMVQPAGWGSFSTPNTDYRRVVGGGMTTQKLTPEKRRTLRTGGHRTGGLAQKRTKDKERMAADFL